MTATLARWNAAPGRVLGAWTALAGGITGLLLLAVWIISRTATPDATPVNLPGLTSPPTMSAVGHIIGRNLLVLALHSCACLAGYLAGKSLPEEAQRYRGIVRVVHDHAGPLAIAFVSGATAFSLATQAYVLGNGAATLAAQGGMATGWLLASRRGRWDELLAATVVTTAIALPLLVVAAMIEVYVSPHILLWLRSLHFV